MPEVTTNWRQSWGKAMRKLDTTKFALAVTEAETDMFRRYQEIAGSRTMLKKECRCPLR